MYAGRQQTSRLWRQYLFNMASLKDLKENIRQLREAVIAKLPDIAATVATTAKALAERNIKEHGFGAVYSTKRVPVWFLEGKELNASGTAFLKAKKKKDQAGTHQQDGVKYYPEDYGTNWMEFRAAQGLEINYVDASYTNKMWANMQVVQKENTESRAVAYLGGTNIEAQNKMNWNRDRYGEFIQKGLGEDSRNLLVEVVKTEINAIIEQHKL
jgi:hypothetical protein